MKTYKFKEAIQVLAHGGFIKEPSYYFSKHTPLFDKYGDLVGQVTYNCYFDITEALGWSHHGGLLKSGKYFENSVCCYRDRTHHQCRALWCCVGLQCQYRCLAAPDLDWFRWC